MTEYDRPQFTPSELHDMVLGTKNPTIQQESHPMPSESTGTKIKKLFVAATTAAAIAAGAGSLAGCDQIPTAITEVQPSETKPSVTTSESGTSVEVNPVGTTETVTPTPKPTETTAPEIIDTAIEPTIEGYTNEVDAETGLTNLVNNETKEVDFIYNPNVWIGDKQVGGIVVKPDKVEEIKVSGDIIPPFNLEEITDDTNFTIESCKNITVSEITGNESNVLVMEFNTPLTFINSCIENNQFSKIAEFTVKISFEKENGEVIKIDSPVGLVPLSCFEEGSTGVKKEYYVSDVVDQKTMINFDQEKVYAIGEPTDLIVKSTMSVWKDIDNLENTTTDDLAVTKEGNVIFSYPEEATVTKTNN